VKSVKICLVVLGVLALAFISMPMKAQNQEYPFPGSRPHFSPLVTSRPEQQQRPLVPSTKFVKSNNPIANHYIVVLNDDVVSSNAPLEARRAQIATIANSHALAHLGKVGYIYEMALKGYSIELPNEAAAMAISNNPQVKWVEEDERFELDDEPAYQPEFVQTNPPWGLSAISFGVFPTATPDANGRVTTPYGFNAKGTGVNVYVLDTGINSAHQDFSTGFFPRASVAADCIAYANCQSGAPSPILDSLCTGSMPNSTNNDCLGARHTCGRHSRWQ